MKVLKRTPRTEMILSGLIVKVGPLTEQLAKEIGVTVQDVDREMWRFVELASRARAEVDEVDFNLPTPTDAPEEIATKFIAYLDSQCIEVLDAAFRDLHEMDRPIDPAKAPVLPKGADPN